MSRIAVFPHLLSLDAPAVAVLWQILFARRCGLRVSVPAVVALGLSVWLIYLVDRLLDSRSGAVLRHTERHTFYRRYRKPLAAVTLGVFSALLAAMHFIQYGVLLAGAVFGCVVLLYMVLIHAGSSRIRRFLPKELLVGCLFAAGCCLAPVARASSASLLLLPASLFAALCSLNCAVIEVWEWRPAPAAEQPHAITLQMVRHLPMLLWLVLGAAVILASRPDHGLIFASIGLSACSFLILNAFHKALSPLALRASADLPLLSPLVLLALVHGR